MEVDTTRKIFTVTNVQMAEKLVSKPVLTTYAIKMLIVKSVLSSDLDHLAHVR